MKDLVLEACVDSTVPPQLYLSGVKREGLLGAQSLNSAGSPCRKHIVPELRWGSAVLGCYTLCAATAEQFLSRADVSMTFLLIFCLTILTGILPESGISYDFD